MQAFHPTSPGPAPESGPQPGYARDAGERQVPSNVVTTKSITTFMHLSDHQVPGPLIAKMDPM